MDERKRQPLNQLLATLSPGVMVDSAWLQAQGISRTSIHDYVERGWLERIAPRVYRRATASSAASLRWDLAVMSAQRLANGAFYVGGLSALELGGKGHYARLGNEQTIHLYDPARSIPTWLSGLDLNVRLTVHNRLLFTDPSVGVAWHRYDLGTTRLGAAAPSADAGEAWDHYLRVAGAERAAIELMEDVPRTFAFDHADTIFEGLTTLRPKLVTRLLEECRSIRAKRLFLFFADRHDHGWAKHVDRTAVDIGRGKRQLEPGGRLEAHYQITVPEHLLGKAGESIS